MGYWDSAASAGLHTHTHPFNGPLSRTTWVNRYQKGKTSLDFTGAREWVAVASAGPYASAPRSKQITMPAPHCSVFYRPDALPAAQPTASKHWRVIAVNEMQTSFHWFTHYSATDNSCDCYNGANTISGYPTSITTVDRHNCASVIIQYNWVVVIQLQWSTADASNFQQEAQLSPRDRAMRRVNWHLANCHATVQKLLIRQVLTKSMVWSWRFSRRQCVTDNVHSTMTPSSRLPLSQVS